MSAGDAEAEIQRRYAGQRILVVDDEPINAEVARLQLEAVDLLVDTAEDGAEALALVQTKGYAVILMDRSGSEKSGIRISDISASMGDGSRRPTGAESNEKTSP